MFRLNNKVSDLPRVGSFFAKKLQKLSINTIEDLFYHVPSHYIDYSKIKKIKELRAGEKVTIHATIKSIVNTRTKRGLSMQIGSAEDASAPPGGEVRKITLVWFNQPFLTRTLYPGRLLSLSGKVGFFNRTLSLNSPDFEILESEESDTLHTGRLVPVYPETAGLSSKWLRRLILNAYKLCTPIDDFLNPRDTMLKGTDLFSLETAIQFVHFPKNLEEAEKGRERLAFNELLKLELASELRKLNWHKNKTNKKLQIDKTLMNRFIEQLPFKLTDSQDKAIDEILDDLQKDVPMNRLLEGDVGSGKTAVAAAGIFASFLNGYQSILMAPTQILAEQHYKTLKNLFSKFNLRISLLTSSVKIQELGRSDIFIGTHALIHSKIKFDNVAFVVIDEQHRFGVEQRSHLVSSAGTPHVLTMTATPIPRTIALAAYGDLDLSILKEMPVGRQKVTTWVVPEAKRKGAYEWVKSQISNLKSQIFWVCPLIDESEAETMKDVKNVTSEYENLKSIFLRLSPKLKLGLLHGRMKVSEKNKVLDDFRNGKIDILVSTPVVEVGIDIPNATVMVIEAAERFGLAQLHQLRGRVGRGDKKSYCLLFSNIKYSKRLKAMEKTHSGFELAELDLKLRGPGEIFGTIQSGFPELKVATWDNYELIKAAKDFAGEVIKNPKKYPDLISQLESRTSAI